MRYRDLPLLSLVCALAVGCSENDSDGACEPENVVDDADEPLERGAVGSAGTAEEGLALARDFVEAVLIDDDPQAATRFLAADAVQPPPVTGLSYRSLSRLSVEGDWVIAESNASLSSVSRVAVDRFRVQGGRIVEHRRDDTAAHRRDVADEPHRTVSAH